MKDARLHLAIEGASPEELARGIAAAAEVFNREDVYAVDASGAAWERSLEFRPLTEDEQRLVNIWDEAELAALRACCRDWPLEKQPNYQIVEPVLELRWSGWERPTPKAGERTRFYGEGHQDGSDDNYFLSRKHDGKLYIEMETMPARGGEPSTVIYPAEQFVKTDSPAIQALRQFGYEFDRKPE